MRTDRWERAIFGEICKHDGIKAKEIAKLVSADRKTVNHYLYRSPLMKELCYQDQEFCWHGLVRQGRPHTGLGDFCGYYGTVREFLALGLDEKTQEKILYGNFMKLFGLRNEEDEACAT